MLKFMDYVVCAFGDAAEWNRDNSYSSLTATSDGIYHLIYTFSTHVDLYLQHFCLSLPQQHFPSMSLRYLLPISQPLIRFPHWA
jgi:Mitochondrial distribution and morphology protein 10